MAGWGDNTFGYLKWGEFGDAYVNVINPNDTTWGKDSYGNFLWGGGGNLDVSLSEETVTGEINTGWNRDAWGTKAWGITGTLLAEGQQLSSNLNSVTVNTEINTGWGRLTWSENAWGIAGQALASGQELSSNVGTVSINAEVNIGWGSDTWGYETWGTSGLLVDVTGIEASFSTPGNVSISADGEHEVPTGIELTTVVGDALGSATVDADVTGIPLTATLQYQEAIVDPTGQELTANDGTANLDANTIAEVFATSAVTWGNSAWGYGVYGNQQVDTLTMSMQEGDVDPAPDAEVTGIAMAAVLDDVITSGDANTGVITDIAWGEQAWGDSTWGNGKYFDSTGYAQAFTISLGTATLDANTQVDITGQELTMQEGDETVTGNANVLLSGNVLTMASGSLKTLIWNEVNTGTAPIVPPGWQEVDTAA